MDDLARAAIARVDTAGELDLILELPSHLRDALWRVESAGLRRLDAPGGLVVAGMGGSAIGGVLARAALGDRASRPIGWARDYGLPSWATGQAMVLCASYSGETEETLAAYEAAGAVGAPRIVVSSGGRLAAQARKDQVPIIPVPGGMRASRAVGYMMVAALEVAALCGAGDGLRAEIDVAAAQAEELLDEWGPEGDPENLAKSLARDLHGTAPVIAGAGLTVPIAYRWKSEINISAKVPSFANELPELDHNEVVGWDGALERGSFSFVALDDSDLHPRVRARMALTLKLISEQSSGCYRVETRGETRTARVISLVVLGDLVALYLAVLRGVNPSASPAIERLRRELASA
ncbi:MAG: bifunctional phosphoglucose/phosphomannose isomerase [Solirubrobacteraceae bacterium]|nr:MAG: bifunctional phosphoglucose/phosphomannose isomerase [Solirubrobacterales bacterium]